MQITTVCFPAGAPGHSWQNVSSGKSSIGHKGLIYAAKLIASAAVELYENPDLLSAARAEFEQNASEGYTCPRPQHEYAKIVEI